mmetsp:Transcript_14860/g.42825  ORF Transcript_14860/g.42825 Transcript_14860/m.42825 type:complete len:211 (-) Transcript_14860:15-647(-)
MQSLIFRPASSRFTSGPESVVSKPTGGPSSFSSSSSSAQPASGGTKSPEPRCAVANVYGCISCVMRRMRETSAGCISKASTGSLRGVVVAASLLGEAGEHSDAPDRFDGLGGCFCSPALSTQLVLEMVDVEALPVLAPALSTVGLLAFRSALRAGHSGIMPVFALITDFAFGFAFALVNVPREPALPGVTAGCAACMGPSREGGTLGGRG